MKIAIRALVLGMLITGFAADHMLASKSVATAEYHHGCKQQRRRRCRRASPARVADSTSNCRNHSNLFFAPAQFYCCGVAPPEVFFRLTWSNLCLSGYI